MLQRQPISTHSLLATALVSLALLPGCFGLLGGGEAGTAGGTMTQPPPCTPTEAPFAKVMNAATATDYTACTITTTVEFNSADWGMMFSPNTEGFVKWSANVPEGGGSSSSPLGGADFKAITSPKDKSDAVFTMKRGDLATVKGIAQVNQIGQVIFYAFEIVPSKGGKK